VTAGYDDNEKPLGDPLRRRNLGAYGKPELPERSMLQAIFEEGHGFVFTTIDERKALTRIQRRRARHAGSIRFTLAYQPERFTPAQRQAVGLVYEIGMTLTQAASVLGITRQALHSRLKGAEKAASTTTRHRPPKKGRPDARLALDGTL
jgi:hypothetical protein